MRTSEEFMDKRIMELSRSRPDDFYDHAGIHLHGYGSDDDDDSHGFSFYPTKCSHPNSITEKEWIRFNKALLSLIEKKMKESKEEVLHAIEGISARLSQLETRTRRLENSVDELKESVEYNQEKTDGKLGDLESLVREVRDCTKDIRDKQDIALAQVKLVKLRLSTQERDGKQGGTTRACPTEINSSAASGIQTQPLSQQPPAPSFHSDAPYTPPPLVNPFPALSTAATQLPIPLHNNCNPFLSCGDVPSYRPPSLTLENTNQPFLVLPPPPPALQPLPPPPMLPSESVRYQPGEFSHMPPQSYQESFHPHFVTPLVSPLSHPVQGQPFEKPFPELSGTYLQPPELTNYSDGNFPVLIQNFQDSHSSSTSDSRGSHPKLPVARVLPHALPTASFIDSESPRHETGNGVAAEVVVDKVLSMGFRRDVVASTVKRLRERGQPLDLNGVLDMMMSSTDPINMN